MCGPNYRLITKINLTFPGMVLVIYYALIHILFLFILLLIPRHRLYWYGHHDHLFVCWIWLFVSLLCFSPILGFFVFPSVSSRIHSWVWYLVIIYLLPCLSHLFIARWFETWNSAFLGSFCFYFLCSVFGYLSPFPILIYEDSSKYCRSTEFKFGRTRWKENAGNTVILYLVRAGMVQVFLEVIHPLHHSNYQHIQECEEVLAFHHHLRKTVHQKVNSCLMNYKMAQINLPLVFFRS